MPTLDPALHSAGERYRLLISTIIPRPIAWVGTVDLEGRRNLAPFSFFMGVAGSPLSVAISVARDGGKIKDTARNILDTGEFTVSMVSYPLAEDMVFTSGRFGPEVDEFEEAGLTAVPGERVKAPRPAEARVGMECRLIHQHDLGSTHLLVGEVVLLHFAEGILHTDEAGRVTVDPLALDPMSRLGGLSYARLGELFEVRRPEVKSG